MHKRLAYHHGMDLSTYCAPHGKKAELARRLGCDTQLVWQWAKKVRPVPLDRCMPIERETDGLVTRKETCPDWATHWPELATAGDCIACAAIESDSREA